MGEPLDKIPAMGHTYPMRQLTPTQRHIRSNASATDAKLAGEWAALQSALTAGGYEELDRSPSLAARYAELERRHLVGRKAA